MKKIFIASLLSFLSLALPAIGEDFSTVVRIVPEKSEPFASRASADALTDKKISSQTLANLLWAANGVSRANGKRTAPSAMNRQEVEIFVFTPEGVFATEIGEREVVLIPILEKDLRMAIAGAQAEKFGKSPAMLLLVADTGKLGGMRKETDTLIAASVDTGAVMQNILLFCAANNLEARPRMMMDAETLAKELALPKEKLPLINVVIGAK